MINWQDVSSSNVKRVGYDVAAKHLHVVFHNGTEGHYEGVPAEKHARLIKAESVGKFLHAHIKPHHGRKKH